MGVVVVSEGNVGVVVIWASVTLEDLRIQKPLYILKICSKFFPYRGDKYLVRVVNLDMFLERHQGRKDLGAATARQFWILLIVNGLVD